MSKAIRRYEAGVERALGLFDTTNEWADYIAFLSRLQRALQAHPENADIPLKQTVAKDLAQCLNPSLPSGVHQKALEVYSTIFTILGSERLAKELALYLPGVSHTLAFASLSIRPLFLSLISDHVLEVPTFALRPALKAILLSLLPGLEDESTEDFDTTLSIMTKARNTFKQEGCEGFFWQSLFLAAITSPNRRSGVFVYLTRQLPRLRYRNGTSDSHQNGHSDLEDSTAVIMSPEPGLLIRCFAAGLLDDQILVQRNFLDLVVTHLPLGALVDTNAVIAKDIEVLVSSAVSVVLRRDMSLNKRLWSWFLGPEMQTETGPEDDPLSPDESRDKPAYIEDGATIPKLPTPSSYFTKYGLVPLTQGLKQMILQDSLIPADRARPFRIALSLMDRWDVGGPVVEEVFVPLIRSLQKFQEVALSKEAYDEVFRSANVFFDGVESKLIWTQLYQLLESGNSDVVNFVTSHFNLEEEEMLMLHLPLFNILVLNQLSSENMGSISTAQSSKLLSILSTLTRLVPERAYSDDRFESDRKDALDKSDMEAIKSFYKKQVAQPPFSRKKIANLSLQAAANCFLVALKARSVTVHELSQTLVAMISKLPDLDVLCDFQLLPKIIETWQTDGVALDWIHVSTASVTSILVALCLKWRDEESIFEFARILMIRLWNLLSLATPQYHVECAHNLAALSAISAKYKVAESTILSLMTDSEQSQKQRIERFSVLWQHTAKEDTRVFLSRSLLILVDMLLLPAASEPAKQWFRSLPSLENLYEILFENKDVWVDRVVALFVVQTEEQWLALSLEIRRRVSQLCFDGLSESESRGNLELLTLLRLLHTHGALEIDEAVITSLLTRTLEDAEEASELQYGVLDTLQTLTEHRTTPYSAEVLECLIKGLSTTVDESIDRWMSLTCSVILLYGENIFQILLKVIDSICTRLDACLVSMESLFSSENSRETNMSPEKLTANLLGGLEYILARAHQRLNDRDKNITPKSPDQPQGLFGSIVTAGAQPASEANKLRSSFANDRLTVILCIQDAAMLCFRYWSWGASGHSSAAGTQASFYHVSSKIRTRSRRILDNLLEAEPQECLETLIGVWVNAVRKGSTKDAKLVLNLLQTLKGGRPRLTLPTTFNAIYNRTNPVTLDKSQKSTLSTNLSALELAAFLTEYTTSLEDDLLEEIWANCTTFLRDVLGNPMPHRQILLHLLEFIAVMCSKIENTNFGEEWKMRRDLGDLCLRLFTAIFTVKPGGLDNVPQTEPEGKATSAQQISPFDPRNLLRILCNTLPSLSNVLTDSDRLATILTAITANVTAPILHSKVYPKTITIDILILLQLMSKAASGSKGWRRDVSDAFNDPKFFNNSVAVVKAGWLPLIRQLALTERTLVPEILSRLTAPTTAGLVFGVGASAARLDADKKAQLNLRRLAVLLLAAETDSFAGNLVQIHAKMEQLLLATKESSPSSTTRPDIYLLFRAIVLSTSSIHLAAFWPTIETELRSVFSSMIDNPEDTSPSSRLQAAKLLDVLLLLRPDEFQLHEWLFVTDTVDAIYPPARWTSSALSDAIGQNLPTGANAMSPTMTSKSRHAPGNQVEDYFLTPSTSSTRKPWLCSDISRQAADVDGTLLTPFFSQLSIHAFEDVYSLSAVDVEACVEDLVADLFSL